MDVPSRMYLSVFYCLCYDKDISTDMSEEKVAEDIDPGLNEEEDIRLDEISEEHWRDDSEEGDDNNKMHARSWEF